MRRSVSNLVFLSLACAGGAALLALLFYGSSRIAGFDARVTAHLLADPETRIDGMGNFAAQLANPVPLILISFGLIVLGFAWNRPWHLIAAGGVMLGANVTTQVMKVLMAHPRLQGAVGVSYPIEIHYPSGHATAAIAAGFGLWLVTPPRWRGLAMIVGGSYAAVVSLGVLVAGWHFVSDVIGAVFVVGFWACLAMAALIQAGLERRVTPGPGELRTV